MTTLASRDRLIVALDVPSAKEARALVERIGDAACFYKVGLELFSAGGYFELIEWLAARGNKVFADLKLYDIPETVRRAVANLRSSGASFLTVHGHRSVMEAAAAEKGALKILAVTVLTSFDRRDLDEMGASKSVEELVLARAQGAADTGCDGVIASGMEAASLKKAFGSRLLVVTPGIRPVDNRPADDQKRAVDAEQAFKNGADYIVVGRPVRQAQDPRTAALSLQHTISKVFSG
ncbi:MAG TPA: orotidine-5'-phosphate decarboxylase [Burkholderiales bacterium]|nr:orotidine-5'-phosphate decarboxylase [Burkholderiales bacterium]